MIVRLVNHLLCALLIVLTAATAATAFAANDSHHGFMFASLLPALAAMWAYRAWHYKHWY